MELNNRLKKTIISVSIFIPLLVCVLIVLPYRPKAGFDIYVLPFFHAILNAATSILLLVSLYAIKNKNIALHKRANLMALSLSILFLISYVVYHLFATVVKYGDYNKDGIVDAAEKILAGNLQYVYYVVLLTHILLAMIVVPFVLYSFIYALSNQIEKHKRLSKFTWALWFYVSVTGVLVYFMIHQFY